MTPERAGISEPEYTFIAKQQLGKQVSMETNTHIAIEELSFLRNDEVNTPI
jgi:hypothetical protein